jgi:hypothetical protein
VRPDKNGVIFGHVSKRYIGAKLSGVDRSDIIKFASQDELSLGDLRPTKRSGTSHPSSEA